MESRALGELTHPGSESRYENGLRAEHWGESATTYLPRKQGERMNCREEEEKQEQVGVPEAERRVFQVGGSVHGSYAADWSSPPRSENGLPCRHCRSHWSLSQVQFEGEVGSRA